MPSQTPTPSPSPSPPSATLTTQETSLLCSLLHITHRSGLNRNAHAPTWEQIAQTMNSTPSATASHHTAHSLQTHYTAHLANRYESATEHASRVADWEADLAVEKSRNLIAVAAHLQEASVEVAERARHAVQRALRAQEEEERVEEVAAQRRDAVRVERGGRVVGEMWVVGMDAGWEVGRGGEGEVVGAEIGREVVVGRVRRELADLTDGEEARGREKKRVDTGRGKGKVRGSIAMLLNDVGPYGGDEKQMDIGRSL